MSGQPSLRVLALVTDAFNGHGGIAEYNRHFLTALAACHGIDEVIVLPRASGRGRVELPPGVRQLDPAQGRVRYSIAALRAAQAARPIDVVFCGHLFMTPLAAAVAKLMGASLWVQVHGLDAWQHLSVAYRRSLEMATLVTSVSRYTRRRLLEWAAIDPTRVKVLPNTVDPRFQPGPKPDYLLDRHDARGKKVLLTVSRLAGSDRYKGHDRIIRTLPLLLADHPEVIYLIVGDGDDRPRLEKLATKIDVREKIQFVGQVSAHQLPDYFRLADIFVMPSTGEGFGIVFLEALASGIEVIGGDKDGSVDALCDGALGLLVDPEDDEKLASAIRMLLNKGVARENRSRRFNSHAFAEHLHALVHSDLIACL
jgi:phosphatidylinositol alpha-1,6-mannosyltransferase